MRLGELLISEGLLTSEQLAEAVRVHRQSKARLGTCLVELRFIDIDTLARALSGQQRVPAVLTKHVAAIDPKVIKLLPVSVATDLQAIPLGITQSKPPRLVVALRDPLTTSLEEIAFMAGMRIDPGVAPEILIRRCLETYYGVKKEKFVEVDVGAIYSRPSSMPPAAAEAVPPSARRPPPASAPQPRGVATLSLPPVPMAAPVAPVAAVAAVAAAAAVAPVARDAPVFELSDPDDAWGEVPSDPAPEPRPVTAPPGALQAVIDIEQAVTLLQASVSRDDIGTTLTDFMRSEYGCGLVLIVKSGTALGWKGFAPDADPELLESIAVPLNTPTMLATAHDQRTTFRGAPPEEGRAFQTRLWKLLRCEPPAEVIVTPVVLGNRVINLLYAHAEGVTALPAQAERDMARAAAAASEAYQGIIRSKK